MNLYNPMQFGFLLIAACLMSVECKPIDETRTKSKFGMQKIANELDGLRKLKSASITRTEESSTKYVNGKKMETNQNEEIIKDLKTGQTVSDVKQEKIKQQNGSEKPKEVLKTKIDIPSANIHQSYVKDLSEKRNSPGNGMRKKNINILRNPQQRIEIDPLDLARYIDETGDEEGIVLAINELLDEGMITREQALEYLQKIKFALKMMRSSEEHHGNALNEIRKPAMQETQRLDEDPAMSNDDDLPSNDERELLTKLQVADYLYKEYEIEIIYQLFKDLFKKKLVLGNAEDLKKTAERFATFLDDEKKFGRISEELESAILETMTSAMVASLTENSSQNYRRYESDAQDFDNDIKRDRTNIPSNNEEAVGKDGTPEAKTPEGEPKQPYM